MRLVGIGLVDLEHVVHLGRDAEAVGVVGPAAAGGADRQADLLVLVDDDGLDVVGQARGDRKAGRAAADDQHVAGEGGVDHWRSLEIGAAGRRKAVSAQATGGGWDCPRPARARAAAKFARRSAPDFSLATAPALA